ncbi:hypothetical protein VRU48_17110 [Pedobacter sp. KR3-3]|uniref:BioF2-like acetyltransferase domain-containing protein n=1 Tax=Pedobacter albus TaxID=3113905 RepID=A0ABU7IBH7_9SPHI|nr:hypothetical protein [Pedobacter sp. KR3-3]MEE1946848.1 hypothetical protein [Pedobacter sp. KR3-3]
MLIERKFFFKRFWFSETPKPWSLFTIHIQSRNQLTITNGYCKKFYTKLILLDKDIDQIEKEYDSSTAYEIRRAKRDGITFELSQDVEFFVSFFNEFAKSKGYGQRLSVKKIKSMPSYQIVQTKLNDNILAMSLYVVDLDGKRVRLLYSASSFRSFEDISMKAFVGRANRLLHHEAIVYFQSIGIIEYDMGGYAKDSTDKSLQGINKFKDSFGGTLVEEYNYYPSYFSTIESVYLSVKKLFTKK